ncbi:MAG: arginase family protein [Candidatus Verstraetearchaeota archaeon]|nr:arginase family protein [Candidatus Verstraetearchaeota archaeon]
MDLFFIDAPLDPDERESSLARKHKMMARGYADLVYRDPFDGMANELTGVGSGTVRLEVEPWLLPTPPDSMSFMLTVENFVAFVDSNGCLEYARRAGELVRQNLPRIPVIFGVDHSLTGGAVEAIAKEVGGESLRLIIFDSHFDFILPTIRCGLIQYDLETNPATKFSKNDPFIFNRPDSYNADSFLYYLLGRVPHENIYIVGVSDYPPREAEEIDDERVSRYVDFYKGIEASGVHVLTKEKILKKPREVRELLSSTALPYTYLSVDVDVCSNTSIRGARFLDYHGISHSDLYDLVASVRKSFAHSKLVGLDFMEFDVYSAGAVHAGKQDRTYPIMAEAFRRLVQPHYL